MAKIVGWYAPLKKKYVVAVGSKKSKTFSSSVSAKAYAIRQSTTKYQKECWSKINLNKNITSSNPHGCYSD